MVARKRILVIDDDETVRRSCQRILGEKGYEVEAAGCGAEGLERAARGYFDCALVDLKMPDMDGMEIVRSARRDRSSMAVLIITGYGAVASAAEAMRLGVADYISKPFTPEQILQAVRQALRRRSQTAAYQDGSFPAPAFSADVLESLTGEIRQLAPRPEHFEHRSPQAVAEMVSRAVGVKKANVSLSSAVVLGILAGVYIGFGAALATLVGSDAASRLGLGAAQVLTGAVFSVGLILVVIAGAELFTGNNLMITSVLDRQYGWRRMLERWGVVYAANFAGALLLAGIMYESGLWKMGGGAIGAKAVATAAAKVKLSFAEAFFRGIGCNWLVCLAVWMALSAKDVAGKVLAIFFPIMGFVALGYEHCVANMYFIPMGLMLKSAAAAGSVNASALSWGSFLTANLLPVTLGNVVGGAIFVGSAYWLAFMRPRSPTPAATRSRRGGL